MLLGEADFEPLGFVVGSSIYHVGIQIGQLAAEHRLPETTPKPTFTLGLDS